MVATEAAESATHDGGRIARNRTLVRRWLYLVALMVFAMVVVGGATRLTDSGLSITEWKPVHGMIPPLSASDWNEEFEKYKLIPEYEKVNKGMSLEEFKFIFWWEWGHRQLGRFIGLVVFVPLIWFWATGRLEPWLKPRLVAMLILGGLQGAVGWWMVASGLVERVDVSQYRLAAHLTFACVIFAFTVWLAACITPSRDAPIKSGATRSSIQLIVILVLLQIFLGGLVAGIKAGLIYNTWPLIDGAIIPSDLFSMTPFWLNAFENILTIQFNHRMAAYLLVIFAAWHFHAARKEHPGTGYAARATSLFALMLVQTALGIFTLIYVVPMPLALIHQGGAIVVLGVAVHQLQVALMGERKAAA